MTATYPNTPGSKGTDTSAAAAESMVSSAAILRTRALAVLRQKPATADEVAYAMGESILSIRPRLSELKRLGLVEDTGVRRLNITQRSAAVLRAKA